MRVFRNAWFGRFAKRERISDAALREAIARAEKGQIDADLGGGVIKQRLPRRGQGRTGGFRVIIIYRTSTRTVFVDGFAKSEQDNIDDDDLARFKDLAGEFLGHSAKTVRKLIEAGAWIEVECDGQEIRE